MITRIIAIALASVFFAALPVTASPPVPPPAEINRIRTVTDIQCVGTVRETVYYTRRWIGATDGDSGPQNVGSVVVPLTEQQNVDEALPLVAPGSDIGGPGRAPVLGAGDTAGEIRYEGEFNAIGGQTSYNKVFDSHTGGVPEDLDVDRTFAFIATEPNGNLSFNERVGLTVVSNGFDAADAAPPVTDVIGGLCPWVQDPGGSSTAIPATNESVAMGSEIRSAVAVTANTATNVGASAEAPNVSYAIAAQGQGYIEASMAAQIQEGFGKVGWGPSGDRIFTGQQQLVGLQPALIENGVVVAVNDQDAIDAIYADPANYKFTGTVVAPGLALFEQYEETSSADGQWTFSKSMAYESQIPVLQIPTPFDSISP